MKDDYCCQCGETRKAHEQKMPSYLVDVGIISTLDYRRKADNPKACNETYPQLLATAHIWRNGGTGQDTHICRGCIAVALRKLKEIIDPTLEEFERFS